MKEHPILLSAPMVLAVKARRKFVTRRISASWLKVKAGDGLWVREAWAVGRCAEGLKPSELAPRFWKVDNGGLWFPADGAEPAHPVTSRGKTRPGIFLPRWASRFNLIATADAYRERLQDITEEQAIAEGCSAVPFQRWYEGMKPMCDGKRVRQQSRGLPPANWTEVRELREVTGSDYDPLERTARDDFRSLINSLHGPGFWDSNPEVSVIPFGYVGVEVEG